MKRFQQFFVKQCKFPHQRVALVGFNSPVGEILLDVVTDNTAEPVLRVGWKGHDEALLLADVDNSEMVAPTITESNDGTYLYLKFNTCEVHIKAESEGLVMDVWEMQGDDPEWITTAAIAFCDIDEGDDNE